MKKRIIIFSLIAVLAFSACDQKNDAALQPPSDDKTEEQEGVQGAQEGAQEPSDTPYSLQETASQTESAAAVVLPQGDVTLDWLAENAALFRFDETSDAQFSSRYSIIAEIKDKDIVLYGAPEGEAMYLAVAGKLYPINETWTYRYRLPKLYCDDYDGDGSDECAIVRQVATGTECDASALMMIEILEDEVSICCAEGDWMEEYGSVVARYDEETDKISIYINEKLAKTISPTAAKDKFTGEYKFLGAGFGSIFGYAQINGALYHWSHVGYICENRTTLEDGDSFNVIAPIIYRDGKLSLGEFEITDLELYELTEL